MKEIRDIVAAYKAIQAQRQPAVLATVVRVEGSSYRQAGARMLITEDGCMTGAISGGCLEGDALRKARLVMSRMEPRLVRYDSSDEDDAQMGLGLGCKGIIDVLLEPLDPGAPNAVSLLAAACGHRDQQALVVQISSGDAPGLGTCLLLQGGVPQVSTSMAATFRFPAQAALERSESGLFEVGRSLLFCEVLKPEIRLLIFGAGNDAIPLVKLAGVLGWETEVIDGRPQYLTAQRFPMADSLRLIRREQLAHLQTTDARTVAVVMSHNYSYDLAALKALLQGRLQYIGMLGPQRKLERMLAAPDLALTAPPPNVYGPTGLDIGASSPEEIALSILAEIQMVLAGRSGAALRERLQPIHAQ